MENLFVIRRDEFKEGESNTTGETEDTKAHNPVETYDIDRAMFRILMDDTFGPMTLEDEDLYQKLRDNPFARYTTSPGLQ